MTRGQLDNWTVTVVVKNGGGSEVAVDSSADSTGISFGMGTFWQINRPATLSGGGWILSGGEIDSLIYVIEKTGDGKTGLCDIHAVVRGTEINTNRSVEDDTQIGGWATVLIEDPASIRIVHVKNLAMNTPYVNTGQNFSIRVTIENTGEDGVHNMQVFLNSDGVSIFPPSTDFPSLKGGESLSIELPGRADDAPNPHEVFTAQVEAYSDNTNSLLINDSSIEDTTRATIQFPSVLLFEGVVTSVSSVVGGQVDPWTVKVALRNSGQAAVILDTPHADDLSFWVGGIMQSDYKVNPPASLTSGYLTLNGGQRDTLVYTVITTGRLGGTVQIRALITGKDKNIGTQLSVNHSAIVIVQAERAFRIISTYIETHNKTIAGDGYVNTDQNFQVVAVVENGLGETLHDIWLTLISNGTSLSGPLTKLISSLKPTEWGLVVFDINADETENILGETFTASIADATLGQSGLDAPVGPALDSTAIVIIQKPALLSLSLELSNSKGLFSTGQIFTLKAHLNYKGAGMSKVDSTGRVRISL
ncbi:hypothetical protein MUP95_10110, partial [bacterium]|nr:hypothetical protein [bacterium]